MKGLSQYYYCLVGFKNFQTTVITDKSNMKCFIEKMTTLVSDITTAMSDHLQYEIIFILALKIKSNFHFFKFFPFIFICWRLITLQYCSGFCHTLTIFKIASPNSPGDVE